MSSAAFARVVEASFVNRDETHVLPGGLDEMPPGVLLAAILATVDVDRLSGHDRIVFLRAQQRMASHYSAGVLASMAAVTEYLRHDEDYTGDTAAATEAAAAEIRVALRLTRRATDSELSFALELRERLPAVWEALTAGDIDVRRARVIVAATTHLSTAAARTVTDLVIAAAPGLTTGQLAARLRRLSIDADPDEAQTRYRIAVEGRRVVAEATVDGTATLAAYDAAPDQVTRAMDYINRLARSLRRRGETRTMDQLRSDVFFDLLTGTTTPDRRGSDRGVVELTVDLPTLTGLTDTPADLRGYGPVIADIARQVADDSPHAHWRWTIHDPDTGLPIGGGTTRRRPTTRQRRDVHTRDRTCRFPGCRMPATQCDIDHTIPYAAGGPTTPANTAPLCEHDHRTRHQHHWHYQPLPNGDYLWTTRLGHHYTTSGQPP